MNTAHFYRAPQAALVTGVHRTTLTNAVWGGKIPGARMEGGQWLLPSYSLHLAGYLPADDVEHPDASADHLPGHGLYYTRHTYAAEAVGVRKGQLREWLVDGQVPGAYQPRGPHTAWAVPVDGLWAAGLVPRFTNRDGRAQGKLEVMEADPSGRAYSLPPLGTLLATAARALERPEVTHPAPLTSLDEDSAQLDLLTEQPDPTPPSAPAPADSHLHELLDAQRQVIDLQRQLAEVREREQALEQAVRQAAKGLRADAEVAGQHDTITGASARGIMLHHASQLTTG